MKRVLKDIQSGLDSLPGLAHRMEQIGRKGDLLSKLYESLVSIQRLLSSCTVSTGLP